MLYSTAFKLPFKNFYKTVKFRIKYALVPGNLICIPILRHVISCFSVLAYTNYEDIIHALEQPHEPYILQKLYKKLLLKFRLSPS